MDPLESWASPEEHLGGSAPPGTPAPWQWDFAYNATGYIMFIAWGVSFYPQLWLNYKRKSTAGMSIAFQWYNLLGFALYFYYEQKKNSLRNPIR